MLKRIMVGLGGTPYTDAAIQRAIELARSHGAELTGVTVVDMKRLTSVGAAPIGAEESGIELRRHRVQVASENVEQVIAAFKQACVAQSIPHRVRHEEGDAFKAMLSCSRYHDLTVFGLRSLFEYYFENEESTSLLGRLVGGGVRPIVAVAREFRPVKRVLIAYSGSRGSAKTLRQFMQLRPWPEAPMRIVAFDHAYEDPHQLLADAASFCRAHGVEPEVGHMRGSAETQLLPHASKWGADLIVMGNSRRNFLLRQLFGETLLSVMQNADVPLFLSE